MLGEQCTLCLVALKNLQHLRVLLKLLDRMILAICSYNCEMRRSTFSTRKFTPSGFLGERQLKNVVYKL